MRLRQVTPAFVEEMPRELQPGILYVCCQYRAVKHLCACGCGVAVNTPLHPTSWTLICDGASVSLWPSIGNWGEKCQSHYWIRNNEIHWAPKWSKREILESRKKKDSEMERFFNAKDDLDTEQSLKERLRAINSVRHWYMRLSTWLSRRR